MGTSAARKRDLLRVDVTEIGVLDVLPDPALAGDTGHVPESHGILVHQLHRRVIIVIVDLELELLPERIDRRRQIDGESEAEAAAAYRRHEVAHREISEIPAIQPDKSEIADLGEVRLNALGDQLAPRRGDAAITLGCVIREKTLAVAGI